MNADKIINNWWDKVKDVSPETVVKEMRKHWNKFRSSPELKNILKDVSLMYQLVRDSLKGEYPGFPKTKMLLVVGALAYLLLPLDLVPDFIPLVGWLDDIIVVTWVIAQCKGELERYKAWRRKSGKDISDLRLELESSTSGAPCND